MAKQDSDKKYFLVLEKKNKERVIIPIEKSPIFNDLEEHFKNRPMSLVSICAFTMQFNSARALRQYLAANHLVPGFENNVHYAQTLTTTNFSIVDEIGMPISTAPIFGEYAIKTNFSLNDPSVSIEDLFKEKLLEKERYKEYFKKILNLIKQHLDQEWRKYTPTYLSQRSITCKMLEEYINLLNAPEITSTSLGEFNSKIPKDLDFDSFVKLSIKQIVFKSYYSKLSDYDNAKFDDYDWQVILIILGFDMSFQEKQKDSEKNKPAARKRSRPQPKVEPQDDTDDGQLSFFYY